MARVWEKFWADFQDQTHLSHLASDDAKHSPVPSWRQRPICRIADWLWRHDDQKRHLYLWPIELDWLMNGCSNLWTEQTFITTYPSWSVVLIWSATEKQEGHCKLRMCDLSLDNCGRPTYSIDLSFFRSPFISSLSFSGLIMSNPEKLFSKKWSESATDVLRAFTEILKS